MKRTGIFTWLLGWGIFANVRSIPKIKDKLHILQKQNQLQDKQIKQLAKYLNLTMHQVDKHNEMLYEMDTKLLILNKTLQNLMWTVDAIQYESTVLIISKLESTVCIHHCMHYMETSTHYLST